MKKRWSTVMSFRESRHPSLTMLSLCSLLVVTSACVTWGRSEHAGTSQFQGQAVVGQIGEENATISKRPRSYWVTMRQSKDLMPRLKGALASGDADAAESLARAYLAKHPGDAEGFAMLSAALILSKKYELAAYYAEEADRAQPGKARLLNIKGLATAHGTHRTIQDYQAALSMFRQAFESDDKEIAAGLNLGSLYLEMGNPTAAAEVYGQVADRCGQCTPALMGQGVGFARAKKYPDAAKVFEAVLKSSPGHPGALYQLALVQKNGFHNSSKAETYLFAILQGKGQRYAAAKERAQALLRVIKGEASTEERTMLTKDDQQREAGKQTDKVGGAQDDADLLMSGAEIE